MSIDSLIARSRLKLAEQLFEDATFTRVAGTPILNTTTGQWDTPTITVYEGPCKIRPQDRQGIDIDAGDASVRLSRYEAKLPADTDLQVNDEGVCTASRHDGGLVGRRFRVSDVLADSWQVGRVVILEHIGSDQEES